MRREQDGIKGFDRDEVYAWLQDEFGDKRAHGGSSSL
jgi:hypothetical protein